MTEILGDTYACFEFDPAKDNDREFILGYPIIKFHATGVNGKA